jgi:gliding motility-associated-like protein
MNSCGIETLVQSTLLIQDYQEPVVILTDTVFACPDEEVELWFEASGGMEPYSWMWPDESSEFTYSVSVEESEEVHFVLLDYCANIAEGQTIVQIANQLSASIDSLLCIDDLGVIAIFNGVAPYIFDGDEGIDWIDEFTISASQQEEITIQITDACEQVIELNLEVVDCSLTVPNIFTPNMDGSNDQLVIQGLESFPNSSIEVYNRWGNLVYADPRYQNNWDGYGVNDGIYYLTLNLSNGDKHQSELTILR